MAKFLIRATIAAVFIILPAVGLAADFSCSGCYEMGSGAANINARALSLDPQITVDNSASGQPVTATIRLENIDPDMMVPDYYDSGYGITFGNNAIVFRATVAANATKQINIRPFIEEDEDYYFVAMSDSQQHYDNQDINPVFQDIIDQMQIINPLFITNSGDLIKGDSGDEGAADEQLKAFRDEIDRLSSTYLTVPGNHDYSPDFDEYKKYLGDTDYSWDWGGVHFTVVNTANEFSSGQLLDTSWLESDLSSSTADKKIVLFHHPLLSPDWAALSLQWLSSINRDDVAGVLDQNGADLVITGHAHGYDFRDLANSDISTISGGFEQLVTGGAGAPVNQPDGYYHYNIFHVTPGGLEHWPIRKTKFDIQQDWSDSNDGTASELTLEMTNLEDQDIPYLRPKFKVSNSFDRLLVKDGDGNYLDYDWRDTGGYNVVYVETSLAASDNKSITVSKASKLHEGTVNTVYDDSTVAYADQPANALTEIPNLEVEPGSKSTRIMNISWADNGRSGSWEEIPEVHNINTTYRFTGLEPNTVYTMAQGGKYWKRFIANKDGEAEITFEDNIARRSFSFHSLEKSFPSLVTSAPVSGGGPQVRMFDEEGNFVNQFFAFNEDVVDNFRPFRGELKTSNAEDEVIVARSDKIKVLSYAGNKLAVKKPFGDDYESGFNVVIDDMNRNGRDTVIVAPRDGRGRIKYYKYRNGKLKLIAKKKVTDQKTGLNICTAQADGAGRKEIIATPASGEERWIKIYKITASKKLKLVTKKNLRNEEFSGGIALACGFFRGKRREDVAAASRTGQVYSWYMKKNENFKMNFKYMEPGRLRLYSGDVNSKGKFKEELIVANQSTGYLTLLKYKRSEKKLLTLDSKKAFSGHDAVNISLANVDDDYKAEIIAAPRQDGSQIRIFDYKSGNISLKTKFWPYGAGFSGGVNLTP